MWRHYLDLFIEFILDAIVIGLMLLGLIGMTALLGMIYLTGMN